MSGADNELFSVEEALSRLGQTRAQGCLLVNLGNELINIYVQDGFIIRATGGAKEGEGAVEQALHQTGATYSWMRGIQPPDPNKNIFVNIREFILKHGNINNKAKVADTGKIASGIVKKETESKYKYFLIPKDQPTVKLVLTKAATVLGRDKSSDMVIDNVDVSRRHCLLDIQPRGLFILDLDSTNGTFVNGILVSDGYLNPGDCLELGPYVLTVNREVIKNGQP